MADEQGRRRLAGAVVVALALGLGACGGAADDGGAADAGGASTTEVPPTTATTSAPPDTRFEGLPEDALPDFVDPAFLDGLQRCFTAEVVGDETFRYEGELDEATVLTPGLRAGFVDLRDCLRDVDAEMACADALAPLVPDLADEAFLAALVDFSSCAQAQLGG